jgi:outer membrane lipoprotein-sorting protein
MYRAFRLAATVLVAIVVAGGVAGAQTLDEVIARNLEAKGGLKLLKSTNTVKMIGRFKTQDIEMPMTTVAKRPNMVRREVDQPAGPAPGQAPQKLVTASDGTTVWIMRGASPAQQVPYAQAESMKQDTAEFDSIFVDYKEKGHRIELVGKETKAGKPEYHVKVVRKDGAVQHYYLDADTGLESRILTEVDRNGTKMAVETELGDYRNIDGRLVPFFSKQMANGRTVAEMRLETVEFNLPLDDALFRFPSSK